MEEITPAAVSDIARRGGSILGCSRCPDFRAHGSVERAIEILEQRRIEGLIVIGGDGSQTGAHRLAASGFPVVGIASTVGNDLKGTEITVGVDTALNVATTAIDRLRATATSEHDCFLVEVLGRRSGHLALLSAIAGGADAVVLPEVEAAPGWVLQEMQGVYRRGKTRGIVVVAEGARPNAEAIAQTLQQHDEPGATRVHVVKLGPQQHEAAPSAFDRLLATRLGAEAAASLCADQHHVLLGLRKGEVVATPLTSDLGLRRPLDCHLHGMIHSFAWWPQTDFFGHRASRHAPGVMPIQERVTMVS
jgi:6-phosphofructokinase 1